MLYDVLIFPNRLNSSEANPKRAFRGPEATVEMYDLDASTPKHHLDVVTHPLCQLTYLYAISFQTQYVLMKTIVSTSVSMNNDVKLYGGLFDHSHFQPYKGNLHILDIFSIQKIVSKIIYNHTCRHAWTHTLVLSLLLAS